MDSFIEGFRIDHSQISKDSYVNRIESLKSIDEIKFKSPITFFVGENGSGKSTLLEAIAEAYGFNKEGGSKNYNFSTFKENSDLKDAIVLYKGYKKAQYSYFFRAETFFNVASMEVEYAKNSPTPSQEYHNKSHGEGFISLFKKLSESKGLYLMDEPEAALSPQKQLSLFSLIYDAASKGSQFIIISHSPILLAIPNSEIYSFDDNKIQKCKYEDTQSYKITKSFIEHKDLMIKELID